MDPTYSERDYWEARYRAGLDSGPGSGGDEAAWKVEQIVRACGRRRIESVLDLGCGDGRLGRAVVERLPGVSYLGLDQAPAALEQARRVALPGMEYAEGDLTAAELPQADLVLCLDVLFHLQGQERHDVAVAAICGAFRSLAVIAAWNERIVERYGDRFAAHTTYRPLVLPPGVRCASMDLSMLPEKTLYVLTRARS